MILLQAIPDPSTIKDGNSALIWVIGFLVVVIGVMGAFMKGIMSKQEAQSEKQEAQYQARITKLENVLEEKEDEIKELNGKVIDNIVPMVKNLDITLGKLLEANRK